MWEKEASNLNGSSDLERERALEASIETVVGCPKLVQILHRANLSSVRVILRISSGELRRIKGWRGSSWSRFSLHLEAFGNKNPSLKDIINRYLKHGETYLEPSTIEPAAADQADKTSICDTKKSTYSLLETSLGAALTERATTEVLAEAGLHKVHDVLGTPPAHLRELPGLSTYAWGRLRRDLETLSFFKRDPGDKYAYDVAVENYFKRGKLFHRQHSPGLARSVSISALKLTGPAQSFLEELQIETLEALLSVDPSKLCNADGSIHQLEILESLKRIRETGLEKRILDFIARVSELQAEFPLEAILQILEESKPLTIEQLTTELRSTRYNNASKAITISETLFDAVERGQVYELKHDRFSLSSKLEACNFNIHEIEELAISHLKRFSELDCHRCGWRNEYSSLDPDTIDYALSRSPFLVGTTPGFYTLNLDYMKRKGILREVKIIQDKEERMLVTISQLLSPFAPMTTDSIIHRLESWGHCSEPKTIVDVLSAAVERGEIFKVGEDSYSLQPEAPVSDFSTEDAEILRGAVLPPCDPL